LSEFFKLLPLVIIAALLCAIGLLFYSNYRQTPPSESSIVVNPPSKPQTISGRASVIDGDTIEIRGERIRLFGIDAPESGQPCTIQGKTSLIGKDAAFALAQDRRPSRRVPPERPRSVQPPCGRMLCWRRRHQWMDGRQRMGVSLPVLLAGLRQPRRTSLKKKIGHLAMQRFCRSLGLAARSP
jgi:hypothetical protein